MTHLLAPKSGRELRKHRSHGTLRVQKLNTKTGETAQTALLNM